MATEYKFKLTLGALCEYENHFGTTFSGFENLDNVVDLLFAIFKRSNPDVHITRDMFTTLMQNKKFCDFIVKSFDYEKDSLLVNTTDEPTVETDEENKDKPVSLNKVAAMLIVQCGVDPSYVMNEMPIWQIRHLVEAYDNELRFKMEWERLLTWILSLPNLDTKKVKDPSDLIPFAGEETRQQKKQKELESMKASLKNIFKKKTDNGTGESDTKA